jgi:signal transduction histidine kinase
MTHARHDAPVPAGRSLPWARLLAAAAVAALILGIVQSFRQSALNSSDSPFISGWWLGLVIGSVLVMAVAFVLARRYRLRQRYIAERIQNTQLVDLLDVWFWQTDSEFRLTTIRPPAGSPDAYWAWAQSTGGELWDLWPEAMTASGDAHDATSVLGTRLRMRAPVLDVPVSWPRSGQALPFLLRGLPRYDVAGRFIGFEGTLRSAVAVSPPAAEPELTAATALNMADAVMRSLPSPASLVEWGAGEASRLVLRLNAEAASYFHHMEYAPAALPVAALLANAPGELGPQAYAILADAATELLRNAPAVTLLGRPHAVVKQIGSVEAEVKLIAAWPSSSRAPWLLVNWRCRDDHEQQALRDEQEAFSYAVSHDLRAPLRVVEGFTRILKEDYGRTLDRIGNDHLERVLGAAARMNGMIDALLAQAKLSRQPMARQPVNLSQLATFVIDDLRKEVPDRLIDIEIAPGMQADGDPMLLRLVLENLLGNAWKYSSKKARARIEFSRELKDGRTGQWVYAVRDNGVGFDMRYADRLFGMFQRLHSANDYQGTGVGLASVRRIIHRHGGQIWAESEVDQGTTFYFTLEAAQQPGS